MGSAVPPFECGAVSSDLPGDRGVDPAAAHVSDTMPWAAANVVRYLCHVLLPQAELLNHRGFQPRPPTAATVFAAAVSGWGYWSGPYQHLLARMKARASVLVLHALVRACRGGITGD